MKASLILINACVKMENPHVLKFQQFIFMALRPFPTVSRNRLFCRKETKNILYKMFVFHRGCRGIFSGFSR